MKTKEELNALKENLETLREKLEELTPEERKQVIGGHGMGPNVKGVVDSAAAAGMGPSLGFFGPAWLINSEEPEQVAERDEELKGTRIFGPVTREL